MTQAIRMTAMGGTDVLQVFDQPIREPGPGEARIRHAAIGVNFIDIYHRMGRYPQPANGILGVEGAGTVEAVGEGVTSLSPGMRVAYAGAPVGAYAEERLLPAERLISLPDDIAFERAAATFLRGLTAQMLLHRVRKIGPGDTVLVHAGAGGLGQILLRWGRRLGATMITTVGQPDKVEIARAAGAHHVILRSQAWWEQVREASGGRGVDLACDGIGGPAFARTLDCLAPFGIAASMGEPAGPIAPIALDTLRSVLVGRPSVMAYGADPAHYAAAAADLIDFLRAEPFDPVGAVYPLEQAARAQDDLEHGRTTGSVLLIP